MQNISFENIDPSDLKNFFRKLCIVATRHEKEKKLDYENLETCTEAELIAKIRQLEAELYKTRKEKDKAVKENRKMINELNKSLIIMKSKIKKLVCAERTEEGKLRNLEVKMVRRVK